ncbi:MAG TPA: ATPase [Sphingomicrobium sp.]|nr:ATPase [Sphingomicrobium sp.]
MPQLNQLALVAYSQFFWLLLVLGLIYFGIGKAMLPKIQSTVELREKRIADDIAAADQARIDADSTEADYRQRMDESRAEAARLAAKAKADAAKSTEQRVAKADAAIQLTTEAAQARIRASRTAAVKEIESVATLLAQEITSKVAGISVGQDHATKAVKTVMANA